MKLETGNPERRREDRRLNSRAPAESLLTAEEVAQRLRVSVSMVYKLRRSGVLPSVAVGALHRFNPDNVKAFMRGQLAAPRRRF